jgi:hypothetical protein
MAMGKVKKVTRGEMRKQNGGFVLSWRTALGKLANRAARRAARAEIMAEMKEAA